MRKAFNRLALPIVVGAAAMAFAQEPRIYTPESPPAADDITILNTTVVSLDRAARTLTVRVDRRTKDGLVDRTGRRTFALAERGLAAMDELRAGREVMLTLRGERVIDVRVSTPSATGAAAPGAQPGTGVITTGSTTTTIEPGGGTVTTGPGAASPAAGATGTTGAVAVTPAAPVAASPVASPTPQGPTRPPVSPASVATPRPVGTPRPVILPSDPPQTPIPPVSPQPTPRPMR